MVPEADSALRRRPDPALGLDPDARDDAFHPAGWDRPGAVVPRLSNASGPLTGRLWFPQRSQAWRSYPYLRRAVGRPASKLEWQS